MLKVSGRLEAQKPRPPERLHLCEKSQPYLLHQRLCPPGAPGSRWSGPGERREGGDPSISPMGLPANYALVANINKGSRKGKRSHHQIIAHEGNIRPPNCLHPSPFISKQSAAFIN